jgi:hypothetical protein
VAVSIVAKNYISFARVLAESFREHNPETPLFVLLADEIDGFFDPASEPFELLRLEDMNIENLSLFRFKYSRQQVVTAAKPYLLSHMLDRGFDSVIFLDADILVTDGLEPVWRQVGSNAVSLTPHLLYPLRTEGGTARELNILQSGVFNGGFVGVSDTPSARDFLRWWRERVHRHCFHAISQGVVYDQRWLDLAFTLFEDVKILEDPGINLGYWNLPERCLSVDEGGRILAQGEPALFMHFSGFDPLRPEKVTRFSDRLRLGDMGSGALAFERYARLLLDAAYAETKNWPYAYDHFDNGTPISDKARQLCWEMEECDQGFGDPFMTASRHSFFNLLSRMAEDRAT